MKELELRSSVAVIYTAWTVLKHGLTIRITALFVDWDSRRLCISRMVKIKWLRYLIEFKGLPNMMTMMILLMRVKTFVICAEVTVSQNCLWYVIVVIQKFAILTAQALEGKFLKVTGSALSAKKWLMILMMSQVNLRYKW